MLIKQIKAEPTGRDSSDGLLIVSQAQTPGYAALPGTTREVKRLQEVLRESGLANEHLEGEAATRDSCVGAMGRYHNVHLACHAFQNGREPMSSGFILHDGRLELERIMKNSLENAELAFLSACQTSTGDEKLSEEAVHLAAGMVAAGYRSVVATMWSIQDKYAPEVTNAFYSEVLRLSREGGGEGVDGTKAAEALRYAVRELSAKLGDDEDALLTWVPYVHLGV